MSDSILRDKSFAFAVSTVHLALQLQTQKKEYILSKQLLRSSTSIGAQLEEAEFAASHADYVNKFTVSLKEANETKYWLRLLHASKLISEDQFQKAVSDCKEIVAMLVSSIKTLKKNRKSLRNFLLSFFNFNF